MLRRSEVVDSDGQVETVAFSRPSWRENATPCLIPSLSGPNRHPAGLARGCPRGPENPRARLLHHSRLCQAKVRFGLT
jgi:hypothetical protein